MFRQSPRFMEDFHCSTGAEQMNIIIFARVCT
jgi:hypothetical protein